MNMFLKETFPKSTKPGWESTEPGSKVTYLKKVFNKHAHKLHFQPYWPNVIVAINGIQVGKSVKKLSFLTYF